MSILKDEKNKLEKLVKLPIVGEQPKSPKEEEFLREVLEYEFSNIEESGVMLKFPYGNTKNIINFTFIHGNRYKLPRFIARHIESCSTPIWKWRPNGVGGMEKTFVGTQSRFQLRQVFSQ